MFATTLMDMLALQNSLESALESPWLGNAFSARGVHPPVNVFEKDGDVFVVAEVPGMKREDLQIRFQNDTLTLEGGLEKAAAPGESVHRGERRYGRFSRSLTLPQRVDPDRIEAQYRNGVLAVRLPQAQEAKPKTIPVK